MDDARMGVEYSDQELTPGFHQARLRGNKTGRLAPRDSSRGARRSEVFAAHGLHDAGTANPQQGQLFNPGPRKTDASLAREKGVAPPLASSKPGFMPGIERKTDRSRKGAIITGLNHLAAARSRTGADRGSGAPIAEAMQDRQKLYDAGKPANWYSAVDEDGSHKSLRPGLAQSSIDHAALRTRTTNEKMVRAVALTSPRTAWDEKGAPGTTDYSMPNIKSAENVVRAVHGLHVDAAPIQVEHAGRNAHGQALDSMKAKAAIYHHGIPTTQPIGVSDPSSQKVPNFEQSLHLSHVDQAVRRNAAGSYTVDSWDTAGIGADEKMLKSDTGYAVAHMTGVRSALKNRELPPNFQARTWNTLRDQGTPTSIGTNRLFVSQRSGKLSPNPSAVWDPNRTAPATSAPVSRTQRRGQSTADKYDLEF